MLVNRRTRRCRSGLRVLLGLVDVVDWSLPVLDSMTTLDPRAGSLAGTAVGLSEFALAADFDSDADLSKAVCLEDEQPDENAPNSVSQKANDSDFVFLLIFLIIHFTSSMSWIAPPIQCFISSYSQPVLFPTNGTTLSQTTRTTLLCIIGSIRFRFE